MTADDILAATPSEIPTLTGLSGDVAPGRMRRALSALVRRWHPDTCADPRAAEVVAHLLALRARVGQGGSVAAEEGSSDPGGVTREMVFADGRRRRFRAWSVHEVDQGEILVGARSLATRFTAEAADLAAAEGAAVAGLEFPDSRVADQMRPFLPPAPRHVALADGAALTLVPRAPDEILLTDLLERRGPMPAVHAAWLCSGLLNIVAFLAVAGRVHGAIAPQTVLVDPVRHGIRLAAGWAFCVPAGTRPAALPAQTLDVVPRLARPGETAEPALDLALVRATVRAALGGPAGEAALPEPLRLWMRLPGADAIAEYRGWQAALESAWGRRRFREFPVTAAAVYGAAEAPPAEKKK